MTHIFISYRRADSRETAVALAEALRAKFGKKAVFLDTTSIESGRFPDQIRNAIEEASVMLVLIGADWLTIQDAEGSPRLFNREDWVQREIAYGLQRGAKEMTIIPVILPGARLPEARELPDRIVDLSAWEKFELPAPNDEEFRHSVRLLMGRIPPRRREGDGIGGEWGCGLVGIVATGVVALACAGILLATTNPTVRSILFPPTATATATATATPTETLTTAEIVATDFSAATQTWEATATRHVTINVPGGNGGVPDSRTPSASPTRGTPFVFATTTPYPTVVIFSSPTPYPQVQPQTVPSNTPYIFPTTTPFPS